MNVKVILNKDLSTLGEEGDVKEVAKGFARNFLFPRQVAVPYNEYNLKIFEGRKDEIEARKAEKRKAALGLKEQLEAAQIKLVMPAGANGKLYGAVTSHTLVDELAKLGFEIERKRIEIAGNTVKAVGNYKAVVKLYGEAQAELKFEVEAQPVEEKKVEEKKPRRRRRYEDEEAPQAPAEEAAPAEATAAEEAAPAEQAAPEQEAAPAAE
jgi:large subunit ribosomal protein L9